MTRLVESFGQDPKWAKRAEHFMEWLKRVSIQLTIEGEEHLLADRAQILVSNHQGAFPWDALVLASLQYKHPGLSIRPLLEDPVMLAPFMGNLLTKIGCVRAHRRNAQLLLKAGHSVAVFPEGTQGLSKHFKDRDRLMRFGRGGFVQLALETQTPLIPVTVVGSAHASPLLFRWQRFLKPPFYMPITPTFPFLGPLGILPLPAEWRIVFGEPIFPEALQKRIDAGETIGQISRTIHTYIQSTLRLEEAKRTPIWSKYLHTREDI